MSETTVIVETTDVGSSPASTTKKKSSLTTKGALRLLGKPLTREQVAENIRECRILKRLPGEIWKILVTSYKGKLILANVCDEVEEPINGKVALSLVERGLVIQDTQATGMVYRITDAGRAHAAL